MINLFKRNPNERAGQEVDDFSSYKIRMFKAVPPNMALICQNVFTGKPFVKTSGFAIMMPWVKSKMVSLARNTIDYPKEKYRTSDGIEVTVDLALVFSVVDPIKYEFNNNDPMQEMKMRTQDMLRQFVASKNVDEMINENHSLSSFDPNRNYDLFTEETGIKIHGLSFKTIELPQSMIDDYEKQKMQEKENKRLLAEAKMKKQIAILDSEARLESAKNDAEARRELGTADNFVFGEEIKQLLDKLEKIGADPKSIIGLLEARSLSDGRSTGDTNLFYGGVNQSEMMQCLLAQGLNRTNNEKSNASQKSAQNPPQSGFSPKKRTRKKTKS